MPPHAHYFTLNDAHEPVEATLDEWCRWSAEHATLRKIDVGLNGRVWTYFSGITDDVTMPGPPEFIHRVDGLGIRDKMAYTPTYAEALARHDRIVEWMKQRAVRYGKAVG